MNRTPCRHPYTNNITDLTRHASNVFLMSCCNRPDIPQSARIVAVAGVFDALTLARPYKKAWPVEEAVDFIRNDAGSHFDPEVAAHFIKSLPEILNIRSRHMEPEHES